MKHVLTFYTDGCTFRTTWKVRFGLRILGLLSSMPECNGVGEPSCLWLAPFSSHIQLHLVSLGASDTYMWTPQPSSHIQPPCTPLQDHPPSLGVCTQEAQPTFRRIELGKRPAQALKRAPGQVGRVFWSSRYPEHGSRRGGKLPLGLSPEPADTSLSRGTQLGEAGVGASNGQDPEQSPSFPDVSSVLPAKQNDSPSSTLQTIMERSFKPA